MSKMNAGKWAFPLAFTTLLVLSVAVTLLLSALGLPIIHKEKPVEAAPEAPVEVVSQWKQSPAMLGLTKALNEPPAGWQGNGEILTSPQTPYPFSCPTDGVNPVISMSKNFTAEGTSIEMMTTVYSAGLAHQGWKDKFTKAPGCAGGDAYYTVAGLDGLGSEAYQVNVSKAGNSTKLILWRYGDIVNYLIADSNNGNAYNLAQRFHENMLAKLSNSCLVEDYPEEDNSRSPFSNVEFKGFYTPKSVEVKKLPLPTIPKEKTTVAKTPIPAPAVDLKDVELPAMPTEYPVWPELPALMEKPTVPEAPAKESPYKKGIMIKAKDVDGPGCGWAFTGSTVPNFDEAAAGAYNEQKTTEAKSEINASAKQWQKDVLTYWEDYAKLKEAAPVWNSYVDEVNSVREAWNKIATDWANYWEAKAIWDARVAERNDFLNRQSEAQKSYDDLIEKCEAQEKADKKKAAEEKAAAEAEAEKKAEEEAEKEKNDPSSSPTPSPSATKDEEPEVEEPEAVRYDCPAVRPEILDQAPPADPGPAPAQPADPRPVDKRN